MEAESASAAGRRGRARSSAVHQAILRSTLELLDEQGFGPLTIEAIASRAGSSKATIYRWWPHKAALVMDAFVGRVEPALPFENTGALREDFRRHFLKMVRVLKGSLGSTLAGLVAETQYDAELGEAFRTRYLEPRRDVARQAIRDAVSRGELKAWVDEDLLLDTLYGAVYFRLLIGNRPLTRRFVDQLLDQVFCGILTERGESVVMAPTATSTQPADTV